MSSTSSLLVVGPFPPPVHGFAVITEAQANEIQSFQRVERFDVSSNASNRITRHLAQIWKCLLGVRAIASFGARGGRHMSLGANSRLGLVYTLLHVLTARMFGIKTRLHHHSYAYINTRSSLMALVCSCGGGGTEHVFLAKSMERSFRDRYPVEYVSHVLSNAPFVPPRQRENLLKSSDLTVGLLSNLSPEKGLLDFLETAHLVKQAGMPVKMRLAGPAPNPVDAQAISEAVEAGVVEWMGPLYGEDKYRFFDAIDLFLFPTRYQHEAQPTVIYEAFASGVPVVAFDRGAVREQVGDCLAVVDVDESFSAKALDVIRRQLGLSLEDRNALSDRARLIHLSESREALRKLRSLYML